MLDLARQIDLPTIAWVASQAPAGAWYTPKYDALDPNGDTSVSDACNALAAHSSRLEAAGVALDRLGIVGFSQRSVERRVGEAVRVCGDLGDCPTIKNKN